MKNRVRLCWANGAGETNYGSQLPSPKLMEYYSIIISEEHVYQNPERKLVACRLRSLLLEMCWYLQKVKYFHFSLTIMAATGASIRLIDVNSPLLRLCLAYFCAQ